ncbi:MAG: hypothetical protein JRH10_09640 [Deltaproteobacteria bacterium]|nr:hypothetical protein [Deltaproteobacteria bacterium]MBW2446889.1 hypothetical protein [Deltaproteobacteria bacterium]
MNGSLLGFSAALLVAGIAGFWFQRLNQVRAGEVRSLVIGLMAAAAALSIAAFLSGPGLAGGIAAGVALAISGTFLALQPLSGQASGTSAVSVGGPILDFTASDDSGEPFDLSTLRGKPFLLKFFRGHW